MLGALTFSYTIVVVPHWNWVLMGPKTPILNIKAAILD